MHKQPFVKCPFNIHVCTTSVYSSLKVMTLVPLHYFEILSSDLIGDLLEICVSQPISCK